MLGATTIQHPSTSYTPSHGELSCEQRVSDTQPFIKKAHDETHTLKEMVETPLRTRATSLWDWVPFKGTIRAFLGNDVSKATSISPEKIPEDVAVLLVNNKHPSIIMGGFDSSNSNPNAMADLEKHVFSWFPKDEDTAYTRTIITACIASIPNEVIYRLLSSEEYDYPRLLSGLICLTTLSTIFYTVNPIKNRLLSLMSTAGKNTPSIHDKVFAIPIKGLNVKAMQKKAEEIKQKQEFCIVGTNCSRSVLEILKAGLPKEVLKNLKEPTAWATPTDIENIADFLAKQDVLMTGTIDNEGNVVFKN